MNKTKEVEEEWESVVALRSAIAAGYVKPRRDEKTKLVLAAEIDRLRAALVLARAALSDIGNMEGPCYALGKSLSLYQIQKCALKASISIRDVLITPYTEDEETA